MLPDFSGIGDFPPSRGSSLGRFLSFPPVGFFRAIGGMVIGFSQFLTLLMNVIFPGGLGRR